MSLFPAFSLRWRLILLILAAFSVIFVLIVQHTISHRNEKIATATESLLHTAQLIAARQQQIVVRANDMLDDLMAHEDVPAGMTSGACTRFLAARVGPKQMFHQAGWVRPNGDLACAAVPADHHINLADRQWFQAALKTDGMAVSDVLTGRVLKKPVVIFAKAQRDATGKVTGIFYLALNLEWMETELHRHLTLNDEHIAIVDSRGRLVVRHPELYEQAKYDAMQPFFLKAITDQGGQGSIERVGVDGTLRITAFTPLLDTVDGPMSLWLGVPKAEVVAPAERELVIFLALVSTILVLVLTLVYWGGESLLVGPLRKLSRAVDRFGTGDRTVRTGLPHTRDDIGQVAQAFDAMAESVQTGERKLERAGRALRILSDGNRALLECRTEQELAKAICRIIVKTGGYVFAWVGFSGHEGDKCVHPMASWNVPEGFFDDLGMTCDETESGRSPTGKAIRLGIAVASNHIQTNPDYVLWRERAQRHGYAAMLALPLRQDGVVFGALNIYAADPDAFDENIVKLFGESANDLAFGIATLRAQTRHQQTRAALKDSEDRFSSAVEASLDALFVFRGVHGSHDKILDFEFVDANTRGAQMLGLPHDQIIGHKLGELVPAARGFFDRFIAVLATGMPLEEEFSYDTQAHGAKWLRIQVVRAGDGIAVSARDITEWKHASAEARQQSRLRTQILEASGEGIFGVDVDGRATFINPAGVEMLQWTEEELLGQPMHGLHHHTRADGSAYPDEECPIYAAYQDGKVHRVEDEVFWRKDGSSFPVEYVSTPVRDEHGNLAGAVVSFSDISARKAQEQALAHAVRGMKTLSAVNQGLVHATNEPQLLQDVCKGIVERGGYRMAWVAYVDGNPEKTIAPIAWAGVEGGYLTQLKLTWDDTERGQGPTARAIRTGNAQLVRDIRTDPDYALWRELAVKHGFASSYTYPLTVAGKRVGALCIYAAETNAFNEEEITLLTELGDDLAYGIETLRTRTERDRIAHAHAHHAEILQKSLEDSIRAIAYTVEMRDPYTAGHERRVGELAVAIAKEVGLSESRIKGVRLAATVHDLGKINIPAEILSKPGKLSDIEFMLIQTHPMAGYDILKDVEFPWPIAEIVLQHHEKMDGSGYPQGLKGEDILLESRIMTVADVVEAMTSHRPYRPGLGVDAALKEIERGKGSAYDLTVAEACLKLFREERFSFQV